MSEIGRWKEMAGGLRSPPNSQEDGFIPEIMTEDVWQVTLPFSANTLRFGDNSFRTGIALVDIHHSGIFFLTEKFRM